jgi:hypothetical protein
VVAEHPCDRRRLDSVERLPRRLGQHDLWRKSVPVVRPENLRVEALDVDGEEIDLGSGRCSRRSAAKVVVRNSRCSTTRYPAALAPSTAAGSNVFSAGSSNRKKVMVRAAPATAASTFRSRGPRAPERIHAPRRRVDVQPLQPWR